MQVHFLPTNYCDVVTFSHSITVRSSVYVLWTLLFSVTNLWERRFVVGLYCCTTFVYVSVTFSESNFPLLFVVVWMCIVYKQWLLVDVAVNFFCTLSMVCISIPCFELYEHMYCFVVVYKYMYKFCSETISMPTFMHARAVMLWYKQYIAYVLEQAPLFVRTLDSMCTQFCVFWWCS